MNKLNAFILEDEISSQENLKKLISKYCPNVLVIGSAQTVADAVDKISELNPDILFLDIELPQEKGFRIFDYFPNKNFQVIFTTAYSEYAIKAFNYAAIHYLLKPIDIAELQTAIKKVADHLNKNSVQSQIEIFNGVQNNNYSKIALPSIDGYHFIDTNNITGCEAKSNYTLFHILGKEDILVSKSLKVYENILSKKDFFRVSRSHIINLNHIIHCSKHQKMEITLIDGRVVTLSENRKPKFKEWLLSS